MMDINREAIDDAWEAADEVSKALAEQYAKKTIDEHYYGDETMDLFERLSELMDRHPRLSFVIKQGTILVVYEGKVRWNCPYSQGIPIALKDAIRALCDRVENQL